MVPRHRCGSRSEIARWEQEGSGNAMLSFVALITSSAVVNNLFAIAELGIGPFGA